MNTELWFAAVAEILIDALNTEFDRDDKHYKRVSEGAHSKPRVIYKADQTGKSIHQSALLYLKSLDNVEILTSHIAIDLLTFSHHSTVTTDIYKKPACFGAMVLNNKTNEVYKSKTFFTNRSDICPSLVSYVNKDGKIKYYGIFPQFTIYITMSYL